MSVVPFVLALASCACAQIYNPAINVIHGVDNPPPIDPSTLVHREVAVNAAHEALYPPELLNPFYKDARIAAGLAKESWLANKEFPVFHRDTQDISREAILKIFKNANYFQKR